MKVLSTPNRGEIKYPYKKGKELDALDQMVKSGDIDSYHQTEEAVVVIPNSTTDRKALDDAMAIAPRAPMLKRAKELLIPPDLDENCAPEYLEFRAWSLAGAVLGGALGFLNAQVNLTATNASFSTVENAALAGTISGYLSTASSLGASYLAKNGDVNPKRSFMIASLMQTANTVTMMSGLSLFPTQYLPFSYGSTVVGAVAGAIGSSAGINIANHMAREQARGVVGAKNGNQDKLAGFFGVPLALAVNHGIKATGIPVDSTLASIGVLGTALFLCNVKAAASLRFEPADRGRLEGLVTTLAGGQAVPEAPSTGLWGSVKELFRPPAEQEGEIEYLDSPTSLMQPERLGLLSQEDYLVGLDANGRSRLVFRRNAGKNALIRGVRQAQILAELEPHRGLAEQLVPGKGELLLTELSYRALDVDSDWKEQLTRAGWHLHAEKLRVGSEQQWAAKKQSTEPISPAQIKAFEANPSVDALRNLMAGSELLPPPTN